MAENSKIEWTDHTFNTEVTGLGRNRSNDER
jgi:hypothetical protein